jgi:hypothetical protein
VPRRTILPMVSRTSPCRKKFPSINLWRLHLPRLI